LLVLFYALKKREIRFFYSSTGEIYRPRPFNIKTPEGSNFGFDITEPGYYEDRSSSIKNMPEIKGCKTEEKSYDDFLSEILIDKKEGTESKRTDSTESNKEICEK